MDKTKNQLIIDKKTFDILRKDEKFVSVVNLGRFFNALMSSLDDYLRYADDKTARESRQKFAAFFAALGYLHEGINLFEKLKEQFAGEPEFIKTIGKLLSDPEIREFNKKLANIRNNTSFHFSNKVTKKILHELRFNEYIFMSYDSEKAGDMHFELSDNININYYTSGLKTNEAEERFLRELLSKSSNLTKRTVEAVQTFIWEYMNSFITQSPQAGIILKYERNSKSKSN